jgi:hypothetical protein
VVTACRDRCGRLDAARLAAQPVASGGGQSPYGTFALTAAELLPRGEAQGHMTLIMSPNLAFGE